ncbi:hypothetical protein K8R43_04100 [archaeon]|nr:hypothetical protein [archaeon]
MDLDMLLLLVILGGLTYYSPYQWAAYIIGAIILLVFLVGGTNSKKQDYRIPVGGVRVHGAEMVEPIIIETTKTAPFRIPKSIDMKVNPTWKALSQLEKMSYKGGAGLARFVYRSVFGGRWE